jgi:hypothetical protein
MELNIPDESVFITNPSLDVIESAVRKSFTDDECARSMTLIIDEPKNLFMQNSGDHIEYCDGPIYACDGVDVEMAVQLYLSYAKGEEGWKTAVTWRLYLDVIDGEFIECIYNEVYLGQSVRLYRDSMNIPTSGGTVRSYNYSAYIGKEEVTAAVMKDEREIPNWEVQAFKLVAKSGVIVEYHSDKVPHWEVLAHELIDKRMGS